MLGVPPKPRPHALATLTTRCPWCNALALFENGARYKCFYTWMYTRHHVSGTDLSGWWEFPGHPNAPRPVMHRHSEEC